MNFEKYINQKVKNKRVCEIGGLGDYKNYFKDNLINWRHNRLKDLSKQLSAWDIDKSGIEFVNSKGFNFEYCDIESPNIMAKTQSFDIVLLLDVIEHLGNIGLALNNIKNYMDGNTEFIITTPNLMSFNNIIRVLLGKRVNTLDDHTVWIDEVNFKQLAKKYGYKITEVKYFTFDGSKGFKQKLIGLAGGVNKYFNQNILVILKLN